MKDRLLKTPQGVLQEIFYSWRVPSEVHERAIADADTFTYEVVDFLRDDVEEKLNHLYPPLDEKQWRLLYLLFQTVDENTLTPTETVRKIHHNGRLFVARFYTALSPTQNRFEQMLSPQFNLVIRWGIPNDFYPTFDFSGKGPFSWTTNITLLGFPKKIENKDEAEHFLSCLTPMTNVTEYNVYGHGERVIREDIGKPTLDEGVRTTQFMLVGSFTGNRSGKQYYLYGTNDLLGIKRRMR